MTNPVFTVGHSSHAIEAFLDLLARHAIGAVADVRSQPHSKRFPQYSRDGLQTALQERAIRYVFLGSELGARREESACYVGGQASYSLIAGLPAFRIGLNRIASGAAQMRIALLCAEKDPLTCHRGILVSRELQRMGIPIEHILSDGGLEGHAAAEHRLMQEEGFTPGQMDIFGDADDASNLETAYQMRSVGIAYRETDKDNEDSHDRLHA